MKKLLYFGSYKRRRVMRPSYIEARLEDIAHDISVATWVFHSPHSTPEERKKALKLIKRFTLREARYNIIRDNGGMARYLELYDLARFRDFVEKANKMMEG